VIRVLIADDHMVVREGLRALLDAEPDLDPVGVASDGAEAVRLSGELAPDVVLMDLRMPGVDGIEAIRRIKARYPEIQIVILTTYDDDQYIVRGLRAGARGYLLKDTDRKVLFDAIRAAAGTDCHLLAGGTDLLGCLRDGVVAARRVVSLGGLQELREVKEDDGGLRLGAMVPVAGVADHPQVRARYPVLAQAAAAVASPQLRNQGTLGGNLSTNAGGTAAMIMISTSSSLNIRWPSWKPWLPLPERLLMIV